MRPYVCFLAVATGVLSTPAMADVVSSSANAFHVRHVVQLVTPTASAYQGFTQIGTRRFDVGGTFYDDVVLARDLREDRIL